MKSIQLIIKRSTDIVCSILGVIVLLPFFLIIGLLIKIDSPGPVFFIQDRLGKMGKVFNIIKFRTMILGAQNIGDGIITKEATDSRITRIGSFLRDTSFDELPQLFNILKGDMSLVGPRPPLPYHPYAYKDYSNLQRTRFTMRPGVTGLSQVSVRNSLPWDGRIEIDIQYIQNFSLLLDIKILMMTVTKVIKRENVY